MKVALVVVSSLVFAILFLMLLSIIVLRSLVLRRSGSRKHRKFQQRPQGFVDQEQIERRPRSPQVAAWLEAMEKEAQRWRCLSEAFDLIKEIKDEHKRDHLRQELLDITSNPPFGKVTGLLQYIKELLQKEVEEERRERQEAARLREEAKTAPLRNAQAHGYDVCWGCESIDPERCSNGHCLKCVGTCPGCGACGKCTGWGNNDCNICY